MIMCVLIIKDNDGRWCGGGGLVVVVNYGNGHRLGDNGCYFSRWYEHVHDFCRSA